MAYTGIYWEALGYTGREGSAEEWGRCCPLCHHQCLTGVYWVVVGVLVLTGLYWCRGPVHRPVHQDPTGAAPGGVRQGDWAPDGDVNRPRCRPLRQRG